MPFLPESVFEVFKSIHQKYFPEDEQYDEECMSERGEKRKVEFIESYWTGGELGSDYQWSDNHGELVRCRECIRRGTYDCPIYVGGDADHGSPDDWFCADGERR